MKKYYFALTIIMVSICSLDAQVQSPKGKDFGFGIILGEPTGVTLKYWTQRENAFVFDLGKSYFGSPRIGVDYLWHFNAFESNIANLYAGPGGALGFGHGNGFWYEDKYMDNEELRLGVRGVFGVNVLPRNTPLETFFEIGVLMELAPDFNSSIDAALGIRFYP